MKHFLISLMSLCIFFSVSFGSLIITEVSYDGRDERVEITNLGSLFSGEVEIYGAKSSPIIVQFS